MKKSFITWKNNRERKEKIDKSINQRKRVPEMKRQKNRWDKTVQKILEWKGLSSHTKYPGPCIKNKTKQPTKQIDKKTHPQQNNHQCLIDL